MSLFISRLDAATRPHSIVGGFAHLSAVPATTDAPVPLLPLPMTRRDATIGSSLEIFASTETAEPFSVGPFTGFKGDGWVYGQALLNEIDFASSEIDFASSEFSYARSEIAAPLTALASFAYEHMLAPDGPLDGMNLARCWNYLPDINGIERNLERYRWFNVGRHCAFARHGRLPFASATNAVPAACALGVGGDKVGIAFLGVDGELSAIENANQISAYDYPPDYGPKAPMFSRAVLTSVGGAPCLFVSGTASITGHQTMHMGDVGAQTGLAISHIEHLCAQLPEPFPASSSYIKVYVRRPGDCDTIMGVVRRRWPQTVAQGKVSLLIADICRADLDVEIELCCGLLATKL